LHAIGGGADTETETGLTIQPMDKEHLAFIVLPGNNSGLIREALLRRSHKWRECQSMQDPCFHFKWQPVSWGIKFEQLGSNIVPG
jgi:hypothetical protein